MVHILPSYRNISTNKSYRDFILDLKNTLCHPLTKSCGLNSLQCGLDVKNQNLDFRRMLTFVNRSLH